jgi:hypothetical protein
MADVCRVSRQSGRPLESSQQQLEWIEITVGITLTPTLIQWYAAKCGGSFTLCASSGFKGVDVIKEKPDFRKSSVKYDRLCLSVKVKLAPMSTNTILLCRLELPTHGTKVVD